MIVVIAEKADQAETIGRALMPAGVTQKPFALLGRDFEGNDMAIVVARGHLYRLANPEEYDPEMKRWTKETLPFLPKHMRVVPVQEELPRIKAINSWLEMPAVTEIVHACDPDREGQLIGDDLITHASLKKGVKISRFWANSIEPEEVLAAWADRRSNTDPVYERLSVVGKRRREMDQVVGINGTRGYTLEARTQGHDREQLFPVGRVQTTALAFVVDRDREKESFKPIPFFVVAALFTHEGYPNEDDIVGTWRAPEGHAGLDIEGRLIDAHIAQKIAAEVNGLPGRTKYVERADEHKRPEPPHNMTSLQADANRRHGLTAKQTMAAAESLYLRGILSYPGTSSHLLSNKLVPKVPAILKAIFLTHPGLQQFIGMANVEHAQNLFVPEAELDGAHSAIVPTAKGLAGTHPSWTINEKHVYDIVARRFLANLMPDKIIEKVTVTFDVVAHLFDASRSRVQSLGWEAAMPPLKIIEGRLNPFTPFWSNIDMNETVFCTAAGAKSRETKAPSYFTEATLLEAMVTAHTRIQDDDLRAALAAAKGIGTGRTRDEIIESLLLRNLLFRDARKLRATSAGRDLIDSVIDELKTPVFTAQTERLMADMREDGEDAHFVAGMHDIVRRMVAGVRFVKPSGIDRSKFKASKSTLKARFKPVGEWKPRDGNRPPKPRANPGDGGTAPAS